VTVDQSPACMRRRPAEREQCGYENDAHALNIDSDEMRIGVLTGGGDCPGLNAVIRAVARRMWANGHEVIGVREGWRGMVEQLFSPLGPAEISGILPRGGTIVGTSRTNPYKVDGGVDRVKEAFGELDALVAIGGEDTLGVASRLYTEFQLPVVGVPKTIDNDLSGTDYTFGFDTAVAICTEAIDRIHTTAESHNRVMVIEVMGRHTGWIAVHSGIAGGADVILIPERPVDLDEVEQEIRKRHGRGKNFSIVVIAEGCELPGAEDKGEVDQFGHKLLAKRGVGERIGEEIESRTGFETRVTVLGHTQRGGSPTPRDRILATRFGLKAADLVLAGEYGQMAALRGDDVIAVPLSEATAELKTVPPEWYDVAKTFFG
jgi:ATP-dependent phosphofructokinase / diphosphate-dependent phosphofructokinase